MRIVIAILTTGLRNSYLLKCIKSVLQQEIPKNTSFDVLVVENNKIQNTELKEILKQEFGDKIDYLLERKKGIPFARNSALQYGINMGYTHLSFIDDDAYATPKWLKESVSLINKGFDVVGGPQKSDFIKNSSNFYKKSKIFNHRCVSNGASVNWVATNNVILNLKKVQGLTFDETMINGGEDKHFFLRFSKKGAKIAWASESVVRELVTPQRLNVKWALKRAFRMGATGYKIESANKNKILSLLTCLYKGLAYIIKSFIFLPVNFLFNDRSPLDSLCDFIHGYGFIVSIFTGGKVSNYA